METITAILAWSHLIASQYTTRSRKSNFVLPKADRTMQDHKQGRRSSCKQRQQPLSNRDVTHHSKEYRIYAYRHDSVLAHTVDDKW